MSDNTHKDGAEWAEVQELCQKVMMAAEEPWNGSSWTDFAATSDTADGWDV